MRHHLTNTQTSDVPYFRINTPPDSGLGDPSWIGLYYLCLLQSQRACVNNHRGSRHHKANGDLLVSMMPIHATAEWSVRLHEDRSAATNLVPRPFLVGGVRKGRGMVWCNSTPTRESTNINVQSRIHSPVPRPLPDFISHP